MAVACSGIAVCGSSDVPRIDMSTTGVVVMDDNPGEMVAAGGVVAPAAQSLWQSDTCCLRLLADFVWQPRATSGIVSWVENVAW